jgi:hypothetical protein
MSTIASTSWPASRIISSKRSLSFAGGRSLPIRSSADRDSGTYFPQYSPFQTGWPSAVTARSVSMQTWLPREMSC